MIIVGLTGSIATGKTTTARIFMEEGVPVHDADLCVHSLYKKEGIPPIARLDPRLIVDGTVDRGAIIKRLSKDPAFLGDLEAIIHPLVEQKRSEFIEEASRQGMPIVVLDVPLFFETGLSKKTDIILVVTTNEETQKCRALSRPGMTIEKFKILMSRQMPNLEKIKRAHHIIDTSFGIERTKLDVRSFLRALKT
jgi:dephospho-CoA kinase